VNPSKEAPELISVGIQTVVERADALGLTWDLRPATVSDGSDPVAVIAAYDGDTASIAMTSMVGPIPPATRVYAVKVPPAGNYIIGFVTEIGDLDANSTTQGTVATAAGTEVAVPSGSWDFEPSFDFLDDSIYACDMSGGVFDSAGTLHQARIRLREGAATITGTLLGFFQVNLVAGIGGSVPYFYARSYIKNTTGGTISTLLSLTVQRSVGAANVSLFGDTNQPLTVTAHRVGSATTLTGLANSAFALT
jgi:hypothetical protein